MKKFINKMVNDYRNEEFTSENWMIGCAVVTSIVVVCMIADLIWAL